MENHKKQRQLTLDEIRRGQKASDFATCDHIAQRVANVFFGFLFRLRFCRRQHLKTIRCDWRHRWDFSHVLGTSRPHVLFLHVAI